MDNFIECAALDRIVEMVEKDRGKEYFIRVRNKDELLIIYYTLYELSRYLEKKAFPGDTSHHSNMEKRIMDNINNLRNEFGKLGFLEEFDALWDISGSVERKIAKTGRIPTANDYAKFIKRKVQKELTVLGTVQDQIEEIGRFLEGAVIAVAKNRERYEDDLKELSTILDYE